VRLFTSHRPYYADGSQRRFFLYVTVGAAAWVGRWRRGPGAGIDGIYNLGTGTARSFRDLIAATGAALGVEPNIEFVDIPPEIRPSYQYFTEARMERLRAAGYNAPFTPLEEAVRDCITQHLVRPDPYL
jgi:ADP-L-glycero-D-manno-heptose 6-epimerase